ncbi:MAG: hypothetical protein K2L00_00095 [Muribaculaceae bacterium]|nr:hypothetical protein [Muribaculaceae bacterium]
MGKKKKNNDRSIQIGTGGGVVGTAASGGTMIALTGGSASASAITHALATVGSVVGGGMAAGVGVLIAAPVAVGGVAYVASKTYNKYINKKK